MAAFGSTLFGFSALFLMTDDLWRQFGYGWADRAIAGYSCLFWAIVGYRLRWQRQEKPLPWGMYLFLTAIVLGIVAVEFAFQKSWTGFSLFVTIAVGCFEFNESHVAFQLSRSPEAVTGARQALLRKVSTCALLFVLGLTAVLFFQSEFDRESVVAAAVTLMGLIGTWTKMADSLQKVAKIVGIDLSEEKSEPPKPFPVTALGATLASAIAERDFLRGQLNTALEETLPEIASERDSLHGKLQSLGKEVDRLSQTLPDEDLERLRQFLLPSAGSANLA